MIDKVDEVIVLDFGGQYSQLITRRIRELGVFCEMFPYTISYEEIIKRNPKGIIFSGGPASVYAENSPSIDMKYYESNIPILGICYGMQMMTHQLGGKVEPCKSREYGKALLNILQTSDLLEGISGGHEQIWMSHGDYISKQPEDFEVVAGTNHAPIATIVNLEKKLWGVQFHPEVKHTPKGNTILENFLFKICKCEKQWTMKSYIETEVTKIKELVGDRKVLCALSGGVDSAVAALIVHKAVGEQLTCVFVNHGLLRKGEPEQVEETFKRTFGLNLVVVDAVDRFLSRLKDVTDPETKRKIIGEEFIRVFEEEAEKLGDFSFLVQGTIYPDVIESGTDTAETIKSHHNVGGLPEDIQFELIEPLYFLFKDEVRKVGEEIGLPTEIVWRQPFPGPGLAIRILGDITADKLDILRNADFIVRDEIRNAGLEKEIWQSFAVLPSIKSVGVMGDSRTYAYPIILRAVTSDDAMTADWARLPYDLMEKISNRIVNEVDYVNRVCYDITSKPPGTIEWE
ncbi:MAG: GMP synthetase [Desulfitibacter sp. BRH_c19]|nr:MAG: GMP synthetase [Desulfitibacter sp. BRH_c19]